jgi:hypothetical protein
MCVHVGVCVYVCVYVYVSMALCVRVNHYYASCVHNELIMSAMFGDKGRKKGPGEN